MSIASLDEGSRAGCGHGMFALGKRIRQLCWLNGNAGKSKPSYS
jgi:hypothetical protein